ncbi:IclR family transcriptional regulator [Rhodococcus ruber]|uniref:IclR family transcriptional regulator n=1 Tax=Rhodococcus ruber TaxID=1830 RepID=UPI00034A3FC4|nr:IclR family transcriptional regulator [Rhodococcus ruber]
MAEDPRPGLRCRTVSAPDDRATSASLLGRAFEILGVFTQSRRSMTLSELARGSGLPKSTTHRLLAMLQEVGAVERIDDRYQVGLRLFSVGICSAEVELRDAALPFLERIHRATRQTVNLAVLRGHDVVYLAKTTGGATPTPASVGGRLPAHATAVGKALLAHTPVDPDGSRSHPLVPRTPATIVRPDDLHACLEGVRLRGHAIDREEAAKGLACIGVPVLVGGEAIAAISVAFPSGYGSGEQLVSPLREASAAIGRSLGARYASA